MTIQASQRLNLGRYHPGMARPPAALPDPHFPATSPPFQDAPHGPPKRLIKWQNRRLDQGWGHRFHALPQGLHPLKAAQSPPGRPATLYSPPGRLNRKRHPKIDPNRRIHPGAIGLSGPFHRVRAFSYLKNRRLAGLPLTGVPDPPAPSRRRPRASAPAEGIRATG